MDSLSEHYIICGFGRTGGQIAREFEAEGIPFVVIDSVIEQVQMVQQFGYITVQGDATLDETLLRVGIQQAMCLVAALPSDVENLYTVLSAKALSSEIRTIAGASIEEALQKLQRAGADEDLTLYYG